MRKTILIAVLVLTLAGLGLSCNWWGSGGVASDDTCPEIAVYFSPSPQPEQAIIEQLDSAQNSIHIAMYYFTDSDLAWAVVHAFERGVEVKVLLDEEQETATYSKSRFLANRGIPVRLYGGEGIMHNKFAVIDGQVVITGSYNWTASAGEKNEENLLVIDCAGLAQTYEAEFQRLWAGGRDMPGQGGAAPGGQVADHVVINEFELNPSGRDEGNEWVELYNPTDSDIDIGGWTLSTTHGKTVTLSIPQGVVIDPYGYKVYGYSGQWLDNEDESIILRNAAGDEVDRTPLSLDDTANDGRSWQRCPDGEDTDSKDDWQFRSATKGESNNC